MNPDKLHGKQEQEQLLKDALQLNEPLAKAYYLKEELRLFWKQNSKQAADKFIMGWIAKAESSGVKKMISFAKTIRKNFKKILAWYDYPISTGILDGTNNKIKTLTKKAYGFRDQEYLELKLLGLHRSKYQLTG